MRRTNVEPSLHPVREYLPLEQGLRLASSVRVFTLETVREYLPLEQGLRLHSSSVY